MGCVTHLDLREGIHAFRLQNYRDAFVRLVPEAKRGQPDAQYAVGFMYYYGQGVVEDRNKALFWIRLAACQGQLEAVEALKLMQDEAGCG
ncbi:MAG: sel1 repeat family protein [Gammaproteobacteria bacterium]|nr:sel1 repeat family protein [Gammaproteobacteria bacterium]